jgi:hypothetical protein
MPSTPLQGGEEQTESTIGCRQAFAPRLDEANPNESHILTFLRGGQAYEPNITKIVQKILRQHR